MNAYRLYGMADALDEACTHCACPAPNKDVLSERVVAIGTAPDPEGSNAHCGSQCLSGCGTEKGSGSTRAGRA